MPQNNKFYDLLMVHLFEMNNGENQVAEHLPKIISVVKSEELKNALLHYSQEITNRLSIFIKLFRDLKITPTTEKAGPIAAILEQTNQLGALGENSSLKDAAIISIVQRLNHYKIALYGTARTFASHLNLNQAIELLDHAVNEEGENDRQLTRLAEGGVFSSGINEEACQTKSSV